MVKMEDKLEVKMAKMLNKEGNTVKIMFNMDKMDQLFNKISKTVRKTRTQTSLHPASRFPTLSTPKEKFPTSQEPQVLLKKSTSNNWSCSAMGEFSSVHSDPLINSRI